MSEARQTLVGFARRWLERVLEAARYLQRTLRGWLARVWITRTVIEHRTLTFDRSFESNTRPIVPRLPSPRSMSEPLLSRSKSGLHTLRLIEDDSEQQRAQPLPSSHFDVVAGRDTNVHDALYESGKRHFAAAQFERALVDFKLVLYQLEREERRAARNQGRRPRFDPEATGFRNLDEYVERCQICIRRRKRRQAATVADQQALLDRGTDPSNPTFWARLQSAILSCLEGVQVLAKPVGAVRKELGLRGRKSELLFTREAL